MRSCVVSADSSFTTVACKGIVCYLVAIVVTSFYGLAFDFLQKLLLGLFVVVDVYLTNSGLHANVSDLVLLHNVNYIVYNFPLTGEVVKVVCQRFSLLF